MMKNIPNYKPKNIVAIFALISILFGLPLEVYADPKKELADHICSKKNIYWENVLHEDVMDNEFVMALEDIAKAYETQFGRCLSYKFAKNGIRFFYKDATVFAKIFVADDRITGVRIKETKIRNDSLKKIAEDLGKLPGKISVSIVDDNGTKVFSLNDDKPLSIASSFKLFVLKAMKDRIDSGDIKWDDVVFLEDRQRSLPSGIMQDWLPGTPVTVKTLVTLMISMSDNTAADVLIDLLGRAEMEKYAPLNKPFMKVKETFLLEHKNSGSLLRKYLKSGYEAKLKMLDKISSQKMPPLDVYLETNDENRRRVEGVGWLATTSELCDTAFALKDEPIITINPGVLYDHKKWPVIGYKGGSSLGVRQFTQILKSKKGNWYCISATWNNRKKVSESTLAEFVRRMAELLPE